MGESRNANSTGRRWRRFASVWLALVFANAGMGCSASGPVAENAAAVEPAVAAETAPLSTEEPSTEEPSAEKPSTEEPSTENPTKVDPANSVWTSDAFYLLARRHGKRIEDVVHCNEGVTPTLRRWNAIDRWGKIVGEVEGVDSGTHHFNLLRGSRGVGIYTTADQDFPSARWEPSAAELKDAKRWVSDRVETSQVTFFKSASRPVRHFVVAVTLSGLVVGMRRPDGWRRVARAGLIRPNADDDEATLELRAIVDINGDGQPEIIYHVEEPAHEVVFHSANGGAYWADIAENEDLCP